MLVLAASFVIVFAFGLVTIQAQNNPVTNLSPTQSLKPLELTATFIVGLATANAPTLTPTLRPVPITPMPTFTEPVLGVLKAKYINTIVSTVGFNHPTFDMIVTDMVRAETTSPHRLEPLALDFRTVNFGNTKYVAVIIYRGGYDSGFDRLLLFRIVDQTPLELTNPLETLPESLLHYSFIDQGFADRNGNGLPDLAVSVGWGGTCCAPKLSLFEIKPNNQVVDIAPYARDVYPERFEDLNHDGLPEIESWSPSGQGSESIKRWFGWNGQRYVDVSAQYPQFYLPRINEFAHKLTSDSQCHLKNVVIEEMMNFLADYKALGRLSEGWNELQQLIRVNCSPADLQKYEKLLTDIEDWKNYYSKF